MINSKSLLFFLLLFFFSIACNRNFVSVINSGQTKDTFRTVIPFETKMGLIIIQTKIKDKPYRFIFDTGSPTCIISPEIMKELGTSIFSTQVIYDVNNQKRVSEFTKISNIEIGNTLFSDIGAMIMDLKEIPTIKCLDTDGLLGSNLFRHATWYIDYERKEIVIANDITNLEKNLEGFIPIKFFEGFGGVPSIYTYIEGKKILDTTIDYGFGGDVSLSKKVMKKLPNNTLHRGYGIKGIGLYGDKIPEETFEGTFDTFSLGEGIDLRQVKVLFDGDQNNLVGNGIFKYYHVILDWNTKRVHLKRNNVAYKVKSDYGLSFSYDQEGNVYVSNLYEGSVATEKGLQLNDKIISVNGVNLESISEEEWCDFRSSRRDQSDTKVLVIERNGERMEVILGKSI